MVLLIASIGFGGCKKEVPGGAQTAALPPLMQPHPAQGDPAKRVMPAVLAHVPADTPYLLAGLEAMPPEVFARFKQAMAPLFGMASAAWQRERASSKMLDAILSELDGKWSEAGIESLGLSAQPRFAVYGLGLQPVVARMAVKDDKAVQATIARIAAKAGEVLPPMATKDGRNYWRHDDAAKGASFVIALADNQVIFAAGKTADVDAKLGLILGIDKPPQSLADGALIKQLMARHGLGGQMIGFVDSQRTVRAALEAAGASPTPACISEVDRMTTTLPRVLFGYGEMSAKRIASAFVLELSADAVAGLRSIQVEIPGLAAALAGDPMLAMAGGVHLAKAQQLAIAVAGRFLQLGTACALGPLADAAGQAATTLAKPLPAPAALITGGAVVLHDFAFGAGGQPSQVPSKLDGVLMIASPDARALFTQVAALEPQIQQLGIATDGKLHAVANPLSFPVAAGVSERMIVVASGDRPRALGEQLLATRAGSQAPLFAISYHFAKLIRMATESGGMNPAMMPPEALAMLEPLKGLFGQLSAALHVTDQGLAFWATMELQ